MGQLERLQKINHLLQERSCIPLSEFLSELEISLATFKRDLEKLRDNFNAPIIYDRFLNGYRFDKPNQGKKFELPGLWFDESEATALVLMQHLLASLDQGGLIGPHIAPLMTRIDAILGSGETSSNELRKRIKVLGMGARKTPIKCFSEIGQSLLKRERIGITYYSRGSNETTERFISPQRLIYYRENWYLDAYCHLRNELRSFAVDGIQSVKLTGLAAQEISGKELEENFSESYGIFSGKANKRVKLRFTKERARWVASENWHPKQIGTFDKDGYYILEFDYNQDQELIMDILRNGASVEVLEPKSLRNKVIEELKKNINQY